MFLHNMQSSCRARCLIIPQRFLLYSPLFHSYKNLPEERNLVERDRENMNMDYLHDNIWQEKNNIIYLFFSYQFINNYVS